jgi:hypothetical protein
MKKPVRTLAATMVTAILGASVDTGVLPRLGDVMVACRDDFAVMSSRDFGYETTLVGLHGSLTADEMLIPLPVD